MNNEKKQSWFVIVITSIILLALMVLVIFGPDFKGTVWSEIFEFMFGIVVGFFIVCCWNHFKKNR